RRGRVVLWANEFPSPSETFIVALVLGLIERGWDVHVACRTCDAERWQRFPALDRELGRRRLHVVASRGRPLRWAASVARGALAALTHPVVGLRWARAVGRRAPSQRAASLALGALCVRLRPELVHFQFGAHAIGRLHVGDDVGCRTVVSFRGYDLNYAGLEVPGFYDEVWRGTDAVHVLGRDLADRAERRGRPADLPVVMIPPAVDLARLPAPHPPTDGPLRLVSVGRLHWKKGHEWTLAALARLRADGVDAVLRIVGGGPHEPAIRAAVAELGLDGAVELTGFVSHDEVAEHLAWSDVLVHLAVSEGFGNAVLEAQAMGRPVVCSDADGLRENVEDGVTAIVVPRRDADAAAAALRDLAGRGRSAMRAMGEEGRCRVVGRFGRAEQMDRFEALYAAVVAAPRRADGRRPALTGPGTPPG
ncbi:MAG TPA: glycosyltransferase family 4 protein, partial [Acidimicrobiales bacterium]|nr:glycosyltransferase family 4 protein [Acidimicrobiales bacterium]